MAKHLILISHGHFCEALKASSEMIMGPQENIHTVALLPSEGSDAFKQKFEETVAGLDEYVVFADLLGGTPCNVVSSLVLSGKQFPIYAGMNMPMVIGFINGELIGEEVNLVEYGVENIKNVNDLLVSQDDEDDE